MTIQTILDTQLQTVPNLPSFTAENIKSKPESTIPWCRSTLLPAESQILGVGQGGQRKDQGLYQIDLYYPQNSGLGLIQAMADLVMNTFTRGLYYTSGTTKVLIDNIYRLPANSLMQTAFYHQPIMIRWSYYDQG